MKIAPVLFLIIGVVLVWTGLNGTLGTLLASLFTPNSVEMVKEG